MNYTTRIARKLQESLATMHCSCMLEQETDSIVVPAWNLRVQVFDGGGQENANRVTINPTIIAWHDQFPGGFIRELGVGYGKTVEDAADHVAAMWMLLVFRVIQQVLGGRPHDCLVHEVPLAIPNAEQPYSLIASPLQMHGFGEAGRAEHMSQTWLWETIACELASQLGPGLHHIRCFTGRASEWTSADVFVDGVESAAASQRLKELAGSFPQPNRNQPLYALKQHLLICPQNLEQGARESEARKIAAWTASLAGRLTPATQQVLPELLVAVAVMARPVPSEAHEQMLVDRGSSPSRAATLVSFLQSAAARVVLAGKVGFPDTYCLANHHTRRGTIRRYDQTPVFVAGLEVLTRLKELNLAATEIEGVANPSAEMNGVRQVLAEAGDDFELTPERFSFAQMIHGSMEEFDGEDLDVLLERMSQSRKPSKARPSVEIPNLEKARKKPWWKFW